MNTIYLSDDALLINIIQNVHDLGGSIRSESGYLIVNINGADSLLDTYPDNTLFSTTIH